MSASASLIPELEDVIQHGSSERRAETVRRIANLFLDGAPSFNEDHIGLFDDVLCRLVDRDRDQGARRDGAVAGADRQCAERADAPARPRRRHRGRGSGARAVAAARETDLVEIAKTKGQAHLFAISGRDGIGEAVTDVLVRRGDPEVVRNVADNQSAKLSDGGFSALVKRAEDDGVLAEKVGLRAGHSAASVPRAAGARDRGGAAAAARRRQAGNPGRNPARARQGVPRVRQVGAGARLHRRRMRTWCCALHQAGKLGEPELVEFAKDKKYEETVPRCRCCAACRSRPPTA